MSNETKAQAISGVILSMVAISLLLDIQVWKSIFIIAAIILSAFVMGCAFVILKMLAWTILEDMDEARERRKEEERRKNLLKKKKDI